MVKTIKINIKHLWDQHIAYSYGLCANTAENALPDGPFSYNTRTVQVTREIEQWN